MKFLKICILMSIFNMSQEIHAQKSNVNIYDIDLIGIDGNKINLKAYKGKKILFVNVASKCGFTKQYDGLQELYTSYKNKLVIIGLPCNQFGGQEPGTNKEIVSFCRLNFGVDFPLSEKIDVKGKNQHRLYEWLTSKSLNGKKNTSVKWNFQKYLIDENGNYIDVFYSLTKPMSKKITKYL